MYDMLSLINVCNNNDNNKKNADTWIKYRSRARQFTCKRYCRASACRAPVALLVASRANVPCILTDQAVFIIDVDTLRGRPVTRVVLCLQLSFVYGLYSRYIIDDVT